MSRETNEVYVTVALRAFAISMVGLFLPIYLFQLGYTVIEIFMFYAYFAFFSIFIAFWAAKASFRIGTRFNILISMPLTIACLLLFYSLQFLAWPLIFVAFVYSFSEYVFWVPYHVEFTQFSSNKSTSKTVSFRFFLELLLCVIGPLLGGVILYYYSYSLLFMIVSILLFGAAFPILYARDYYQPMEIEKINLKSMTNLPNVGTFIGEGFRNASTDILWPFFIFWVGVDFIGLGGIFAGVDLAIALLVLYVGVLCERYRNEIVLKFGSIIHSATILFRGFLDSVLGVTCFAIAGGLTFAFLAVPYSSIFYNKAIRQGAFNVILCRELYLNISRFVFMLLMAYAFWYTQDLIKTFVIAFILGTIGTLSYSLFKDD